MPRHRKKAFLAVVILMIVVGICAVVLGYREFQARDEPRTVSEVERNFTEDLGIGSSKDEVVRYLGREGLRFVELTASEGDPLVVHNNITIGALILATSVHSPGTLLFEDAEFLIYLVLDDDERLVEVLVTKRSFRGL